MTPWHYRWLCQLAYIDPPEPLRKGWSLGELSRELLAQNERNELPCGKLSARELEALSVVSDTQALSRLTLIDFVNRNSSTGLVAYILQSADGGFHIVFRGSESRGCGVPTSVDWLDNFLAPLIGSIQYPEIERLARRFSSERSVVFSGHSKGAHNALYALSAACIGARAVTFNGQGFPARLLSHAQKRRLRLRGVNYVVRGDLVGLLLRHPERRIFVRKHGSGDPHALSSLSFDRFGQPVAVRNPLWSLAFAWGFLKYIHARARRIKPHSNKEML